VLSQGVLCDAAVNVGTYPSLQRHRAVLTAIATLSNFRYGVHRVMMSLRHEASKLSAGGWWCKLLPLRQYDLTSFIIIASARPTAWCWL